MFVSAKIKKQKNLYITIITYSYYGLYRFTEKEIHNTYELAAEYMLKERCNGCLSLELEEPEEKK